MSESEKDQPGADQDVGAESQQEEQVNDPLTRTDAGAPKVSWQASPGDGGDASVEDKEQRDASQDRPA